MDTRGHASIGPTTKCIAEIDDHLVSQLGCDRNKAEILAPVLEFQATQAILEEEGDDAEVGVRPSSFDGAASKSFNAHFWIVKHSQFASIRLAHFLDGPRWNMQSDLNSLHDPHASTLSSCEVPLHELLESRQVNFVGPQIGKVGIIGRPTIEVLLLQFFMSVVDKNQNMVPLRTFSSLSSFPFKALEKFRS